MTERAASRRRFLEIVAGTAAFAAGGAACSSAAGVGPDRIGDVAAGSVTDLTVGSLHAIGSSPVCIGRDAQGIYAMTLTCTHAACNIAQSGSVSPSGLSCSCHGSRFDAQGNVVTGPAPSPLQHFAVTEDASGALTVHTGTDVGPTTRLAVG